ncbi:hypothetical protein OJAV_G00102670 [Oryzias javanicus]|uniref:L27 domain-containing protein n=1 Tax=Oryzias javanicus TaxID=123683 RepID=A0A3S2MUW4_ORYJA|nr:hypothetical protein OJAV_G00102670 [Oryzias javanicus]
MSKGEEEHAKLPDRLLPNFGGVLHEVISVFCHIPTIALQQLCTLTGSLTGFKPGEENNSLSVKIIIFLNLVLIVFVYVANTMVHKYDTERAVGLLKQYQANLTSPEEQALKTSVGKVSAILGSHLFQALLDIQECYEVTLQQSAEQTIVKEDSKKDVWEDLEDEGVSRVRVTSSRSPHKVERVSGLVVLCHVDMPKVREERQPSGPP